MTDDRDLTPVADPGEPEETSDLSEESEETEGIEEYGLLSTQEIDHALETLEAYPATAPEEETPEDELVPESVAEPERTESTVSEEEERLRQPRAQVFRRRLRNQIGMLPLALFFLALGGYLIARQQGAEGLPDLSDRVLAGGSILAVAAGAIFHSLIAGRRERGLLFAGVFVWCTAGMLGVLVYGIDGSPNAADWWPLLVISFGTALVFTFVIERTHDARLLLWGVMAFVAGGAAFAVTDDRIQQDALDEAAEWWPLLLSVAGIGLLPLAFRRRMG